MSKFEKFTQKNIQGWSKNTFPQVNIDDIASGLKIERAKHAKMGMQAMLDANNFIDQVNSGIRNEAEMNDLRASLTFACNLSFISGVAVRFIDAQLAIIKSDV